MTEPVFAVCVLIKDKNNKFLSVTRNQNHDDLGLPGGKVEPSEDPKDAIKREVKEETGLALINFIEIYDGICGGDRVITYLGLDWEGSIETEEDHEVRWVEKEDLLTETCTFQKYNISLFNSIMERVDSKVSEEVAGKIKIGSSLIGIFTALYLLTFPQYILIGLMLAVADTFRTKNLVKNNKWMLENIKENVKENEQVKNVDLEGTLFVAILMGNLFSLGLFWPGELLFIFLRSIFPKLDTDDWVVSKFERKEDE